LSESGATEFDSIHAIREALKERQPEAPAESAHQAPGEMVSERVLEQEGTETASAAPGRLLYSALLRLAIAVVVVAAGYLLGPTIVTTIERHWAGSPQASQGSLAEGTETVPAQRAADRSSAEQRAPAKSLPELRKLADQGDADAQWQVGLRYHNGEDVPQDDAQAMQWFLRAAEQGNVTAQAALGAYYWAGRGVPEDLSKAYMWSEIALAGGDGNSKSRLEVLASQMTPEQVAAANQQAEQWIRTHGQRAKSEAN
jgi:TPR repeat protein